MAINLQKIIDDLKKDAKKVKESVVKQYDKNMRKIRKQRTRKKAAGSTKNLKRDQKARKKAEQLAKLPKSRVKRILYYLHPGRAFRYWFSKEGLIMGLKIVGVMAAVFIFLAISLFAYFRRDIQADPASLQASLLEQTTKFYDSTGEKLIYTVHGDQDRTWVEIEDIALVAQQATIAVEDKDFYNHNGFSVEGVIGAAYRNVFSDQTYTAGGSTITQQFVKNAFLSTEKTYTRKIKELILALEMERLYSKDEILEFYLNQIPYGSTEYGIESASQSFFDKPASELNIAESALLAALPQAPSALSPYNEDTTALIARQQTIIGLMQDQGYITQEQADEAFEFDVLENLVPLEEKNQFKNLIAPHFVIEAQKILEEQFGKDLVASGGLKVTTTLDYDMQKIAKRAVEDNMDAVERPVAWLPNAGGDNASLVSVDVETGNIVAMVGSRDYNYPGYGAFNAALGNRQPGSSFKPYVYAQLFYDERWGADSYIYDTRTRFGDYEPQNFDSGFKGRQTVRQALGQSRNIPAVKAMYLAGEENVINLARNMGVDSLGRNGVFLGLSAALGSGEVTLLEHTLGYSTFARDGDYLPYNYILKVENAAGEVLYEWEKPEPVSALDPQIAYMITDILKDDNARAGVFGFRPPNMVVPGLTHTVKTGTTNDAVDGWMMGYTNYYATGVWVGNHDNAPMNWTGTSRQTGPIWTQFMREVHADLEDVPIHESNNGTKRATIDRRTGYAPTDSTTETISGLYATWAGPEQPPASASYTIDSVSGNLATECTPELARETVKNSVFWPEILPSDPFFSTWARGASSTPYPYGASAEDVDELDEDDVHSCDDILPSVVLTLQNLGDNSYEFIASVTEGTHPVDKLEFKVDGDVVGTRNINGSGVYTLEYEFDEDGKYDISVEVIDEVLYSAGDTKKNYNVDINEEVLGDTDEEGNGQGGGLPPGLQRFFD